MRNIEYEIKLGDNGKPYVHLENLDIDVEDMFFCFEITKYRLHAILNDENNDFLPKEALEELALAGSIVDGISQRIGNMVIEGDTLLGDIDNILNPDEEDDD